MVHANSRKARCFSLFFLLAFPLLTQGATTSGIITSLETWNGTITLTGDVIVASSGKLTIEPGTIVQCTPNTDDQGGGGNPQKIELIIAGGEIIANGTEAAPIHFTSASDTPAPGDWGGIQVESNATFSHCTIDHAITGLHVTGGATSLLFCQIQDNLEYGLSLDVKPSIKNCTVQNNAADGIHAQADCTITDSIIADNGARGVYCNGYVNMVNSQIRGNGDRGVLGQKVRLESCVSEGNNGHGASSGGDLTATRSTFSGNRGEGINCPNGLAKCLESRFHDNVLNGVYTQTLTAIDCQAYRNGESGFSFRNLDPQGLSGNTVTQNEWGLKIRSSDAEIILPGNNDIYANHEYELVNANRANIIVKSNFWGNPTTQELRNQETNISTFFDVLDNAVLGAITVETYSEARYTNFTPPAATPTPTPTPTGDSTPTLTEEPTPSPTPDQQPSPTATPSLPPDTTPSPTSLPTNTSTPRPTSTPQPTWPDPTPRPISTDPILVSGDTKYGTISQVAQTDTYQFIAEAGQTIILLMTRISGGMRPYFEIFDPSGELLFYGGEEAASIQWGALVDQDGLYYIRCKDIEGTQTGSYTLSMITHPGQTIAPSDLDGGMLSSQSAKTGFIDIGDIDAYAFYGMKDDHIFISFARQSGNMLPTLLLLDPDGSIVATSESEATLEIEVPRLEKNGKYLILCQDSTGQRTGYYTLSFSVLGQSASCLLSDANGDNVITPADAQAAFDLYLHIVKGNIIPISPYPKCSVFWRTDLSGDGKISPGDAQLIFITYLDSISAKRITSPQPANKTLAASTVQIDTLHATAGNNIDVPIRITQGVNIQAFSMEVEFDPNKLEYLSIQRGGTLTEPFSSIVGIPRENNVVISGFAGTTQPVQGDGILINLRFRIKPTAYGATIVTPTNFLDDLNGAQAIAGTVIIEEAGFTTPVITIHNANVSENNIASVPVFIQNAEDITSFSFTIDTDYASVTFLRIENQDSLTSGYSSLLGVENKEGGITIAGFAGSGEPVQGAGLLFSLIFEITNGDATNIPITLTNLIDDVQFAQVIPGEMVLQTPIQEWALY